MKKLTAILISLAILISVMVTANAVKYEYGRSAEPNVLNFYIDSNKTPVKNFKNLTLKINWNVGNKPNGDSGIVSVTSRIEEAKIDTVYNKEDKKDSGVTTFRFASDKGVELGGDNPFLSIAIYSSTSKYDPTVDFYTEGQFIGEDSVDYAKKDIITTGLVTDPEATTTPEGYNELNVENIGETEANTTTPVIETVEPTTAATEPTQPTTSVTEKPEPAKPKQANPVKVSVKTKTVKAKQLKSKKQTVKPLTITKAQGKVIVSLIKSGTTKAIRNKVTVSNKGVITLKKGKYSKATYNIKVKITAKGNSKYKAKTVTKTAKIKVK